MQKSLCVFKAERYLLQGIRHLQNHCNGQRSVGCGLSLRPTPTYVQDRPQRRATTSEVATGVLSSGMSGISCCDTAIWKPTAEILCSQSHGLSLNTVKAGNHAESLLQKILTPEPCLPSGKQPKAGRNTASASAQFSTSC